MATKARGNFYRNTITVPPLSELCTLRVAVTDKVTATAASAGPSRLTELCRLIICQSGGDVLACPMAGSLLLTMARSYYTEGKILPITNRLNLENVEAGNASLENVRQSLQIWVHYFMAPTFCRMESNLFFLNNGDGIFRQKSNWVGPAGTIDVIAKDARVEVLLQVGSVNLIFYSKGEAIAATGAPMGDACIVLPRLSRGYVTNYYEPAEYEATPGKMTWAQMRRYWRRVYGIALKVAPEPCVDVQFGRGWGNTLQYPLSTVLHTKPNLKPINNEASARIAQDFFETLQGCRLLGNTVTMSDIKVISPPTLEKSSNDSGIHSP